MFPNDVGFYGGIQAKPQNRARTFQLLYAMHGAGFGMVRDPHNHNADG